MSDLFNFPEPIEEEVEKELTLWATYYHLVNKIKEADNGVPLLDRNEMPLGPKISKTDFCKAAMEGTVAIENDTGQTTVYNYARKRSREIQVICPRHPPSGYALWKVSDGPFGEGIPGFILAPLRTIAVDGSQNPIKYQSVIYIPQARGQKATLPSGEEITHDGYFFAVDTGGLIKGNHIDIFAGIEDKNPFPNFIKSRPDGIFGAKLIKNEGISEALAKLHKA